MTSTNETDDKSFNEKELGTDVPTPNEDDGGAVDSGNHGQYYMSGPELGILIGGLCLALFLLGLDTAIVSTVSNASKRAAGRVELTFHVGDPEDHRKI